MKSRDKMRARSGVRGAPDLSTVGNGYPANGARMGSGAAHPLGHALLMRQVRLLSARGDGERGSGWS